MTVIKKVQGKKKGNGFERRISNLLSKRFEPLLNIEKAFYRNADSGSYFGGSNKQRIQTHTLDYAVFGDLVCPKNFKFSIECKHYKTPPTFKSIVNHDVTQWNNWLNQATQDAKSSNRQMCLIVKYNNVDEIIFLTDNLNNNIKCNYIIYQQKYFIYSLSDWLLMPDDYFFN